ncbi:hypothetical protein [Geminisphaera colitermitum]|uniref:hypothetical protein n=1 Tax=Geminisphaera colitermitum TaxID=1148786 RepID=UPI000158CBAD|nr:hypothetical protein [Geminisphaera colitermitum]
MANVPTIRGDNTVLFGADGVYSGNGIIVSGSKKGNSEKLEVGDENGFTVAVIWFNNKKQCSFEMIVKTAAPELEEGDEIELCGVAACYVDDVEEVWAQKDVRRFRVNATKYAAIVSGA